MDIPRLAISVRQPWAWAIIHGGKDIENRSWKQGNPGLNFRGPVCIHASKGMTRDEYADAAESINMIGARCPGPADLTRGGIIGIATIVDVVKHSDSPWFFGPKGLLLTNARAVPFIPAQGALGFFEWKQAKPETVPVPARWMQPAVNEVTPIDRPFPFDERQGRLL